MTTLVAKPFEGMKPGIYPAEFTSYEETSGEWGPSVKLVWTLDGKKQDGTDITKWQWVSQKLSPRSNLWGILKTFGFTPVLKEEYELDDLLAPHIGKRVNLVIKLVDGPNGETDKITDIMPFEGAGAPPQAVLKPQPQAAAAAMEVTDACMVEGCGKAVDKYTKGGKALCKDHDADDL